MTFTMSASAVSSEAEVVAIPAANSDTNEADDSLDATSNAPSQHCIQPGDGPATAVEDHAPDERSSSGKFFSRLGGSKTGNILTFVGLVLALFGFLWGILAQRWTVKNGNLQTCAALTQIGRQSSVCNSTLEAGVPSFFGWRRSLDLTSPDSFDFATSTRHWQWTVWSMVLTLTACITGLIYLRPRMSVFRPAISMVRVEHTGFDTLAGPTSSITQLPDPEFPAKLVLLTHSLTAAKDALSKARMACSEVGVNLEGSGEHPLFLEHGIPDLPEKDLRGVPERKYQAVQQEALDTFAHANATVEIARSCLNACRRTAEKKCERNVFIKHVDSKVRASLHSSASRYSYAGQHNHLAREHRKSAQYRLLTEKSNADINLAFGDKFTNAIEQEAQIPSPGITSSSDPKPGCSHVSAVIGLDPGEEERKQYVIDNQGADTQGLEQEVLEKARISSRHGPSKAVGRLWGHFRKRGGNKSVS